MTRTMTPRREAWPLHLQNSAFPANKDTIKIDGLQCLPALDNPRADVYNKDKERRCPCKRLAPHRHTVKKNDRQSLRAVGGHFFLSLLPLSCEIRHAMSKVTCTTWANNISRLTMRARSAKTSARVMWHPPFTQWASGGKLQKAPSHAHFVPKNDVVKPGGA